MAEPARPAGPPGRKEDAEASLDVAQAKASVAERNIAWVRFAIIAFNITLYYAVLYPAGVPWLAATVSVVAGLYALYVVALRPYERYAVLRAAAFTTLSDGTLIVAWLVATGGAASPFYPLWFASLVAVVFRYEWHQTAIATGLYATAQAGVLAFGGALWTTQAAVQLGYLGFVGALGALLAHATHAEIASRVHLEKEGEVERLKELNAFKTGLLNMASHELNTPLTPLKLQLHLLQQEKTGPLNEKQRRSVGMLEHNVERLGALVQDILDVARLQSHRLDIHPRPVRLAPLIDRALDPYRDALDQKGVGLKVGVEGDPEVHADPGRLEQVLHNLLSNALKFTPSGSVAVRATTENGMARVEVRDTGIGLDPARMDRLFEPFSRVHDDDAHRVGGTGLGLYICKGIVEEHGGRITGGSDGRGQGSVFVFTVPLAPAPAVAEERASVEESK